MKASQPTKNSIIIQYIQVFVAEDDYNKFYGVNVGDYDKDYTKIFIFYKPCLNYQNELIYKYCCYNI